MKVPGCAAGAVVTAAQQAPTLPRPLRDALEHFDRRTLRTAGVPHLASRAVERYLPNAHGFMFVGQPGGPLRMYGYGLQAGGTLLTKRKVKEFIACSQAQLALPPQLIEALRARTGKLFPSHEALLEDLRVATGSAGMQFPWRAFGTIFMQQLCRSSRMHFTMAAKTVGCRVTWGGIVLQPRQLERLRGALPAWLWTALVPHCGQRFDSAEALLERAHPQSSASPFQAAVAAVAAEPANGRANEPCQQAAWQAWAAAIHGEAQHVMGTQRAGHPIEQDDEAYARAQPTLRCRAYPGLRHEFVRDAWRQLFWGREYLRERVLGLNALTGEEALSLRARLAPVWMRCVPGSTAEAMPQRWFEAYAQRLPAYDNKRNCNSAASTLLREAMHLQRVHNLREGLPAEPVPTLRGASWRNLGTAKALRVWRPVPYAELEAMASLKLR